jgi:hypothetical protein
MECNLTCIEGADGNSELTGGYCPTYSENGKFPQSINLRLDHAIDSSKFGTMMKGAGCFFVGYIKGTGLKAQGAGHRVRSQKSESRIQEKGNQI